MILLPNIFGIFKKDTPTQELDKAKTNLDKANLEYQTLVKKHQTSTTTGGVPAAVSLQQPAIKIGGGNLKKKSFRKHKKSLRK